MVSPIELSLLIPTYNEELIVEDALRGIASALGDTALSTEIIICDDGSDSLPALVEQVSPSLPYARVSVQRGSERRGKGAALAQGFLSAEGNFSGFIDADLSISPVHLVECLSVLRANDADLVIGYRSTRKGGRSGACKNAASFIFRRALTVLFAGIGPEAVDSQCGMKMFRASVAKELYSNLLTRDGLTDLEVLLRAVEAGYRTRSLPVIAEETRPTKRTFLRTCRRDFRELRALVLRFGRLAPRLTQLIGERV